MKATIEFNLESLDENNRFNHALRGADLFASAQAFELALKSKIKNETWTDEGRLALKQALDSFYKAFGGLL